MATTTIPWGDGSGDNIYLTYSSASGDQTVTVSSDANTGSARTQTVTFTSGVGSITRSLTVNQEAGLPYTPVDYIETDGVAYIDTGIKGNAPKSFTGKMLPICPASATASSYYLGCVGSATNTRFIPLAIYGNKNAAFGYGSGYYGTTVSIANSIDNATPFEFHTILQRGTCRIGVKQQGASSFTDYTRNITSTISSNENMLLFAVFWGSGAVKSLSGTRCYWVKIYNSNNYTNLVFDGIPVFYNGEYGIWDLVSNSFFGNAAASGAFTGPAIN